MSRDDHSSLGQFVYPQTDNSFFFNYRDTVNVSWTTFDPNPSAVFLLLYYWIEEGQPWTMSLNTSVSLNGSKPVRLSVAPQSYLGQFNIKLFYNNETNATYLSEIFNVTHDPSQVPLNWPAPSTSQVSLKSEQTTTAITTESSSQANTTPSSQLDSTPSPSLDPTQSSTTRTSGLKGRVIAGISVGSIAGLSVLILTAIILMRHNRRNRRSQNNRRGMLKPAVSAMPPVPSFGVLGASEIAGESAATELAGTKGKWGELCAEQAALKELPAAEHNVTPIELSARDSMKI